MIIPVSMRYRRHLKVEMNLTTNIHLKNRIIILKFNLKFRIIIQK